jgi:hypothetical protein
VSVDRRGRRVFLGFVLVRVPVRQRGRRRGERRGEGKEKPENACEP